MIAKIDPLSFDPKVRTILTKKTENIYGFSLVFI